MIAALILMTDEIVIRNPHYDYCMTLDPNGWQFILSGCDIYGGAGAAIASVLLAGLAGWAMKSLMAGR